MENSGDVIIKDLPRDVKKAMRAFSNDILVCIVNANGGSIEIPADHVDNITDELSVHIDGNKMIIKAHPKDFRILVIESNYHIDEKHWTVEYPKDIEYVREIFSKLKNKNIFYTEDILQLIKENSSLSKI